SHENEEVKALYDEYLKTPNGPISHKLLHTHYKSRELYSLDVEDRVF
ncbi:MAG: iron hydrogenase small subunit, partial [Lachnospiraceae bacterium]|nr:iron hydrogenase small subunit [Lachnospiraceae bacterium]